MVKGKRPVGTVFVAVLWIIQSVGRLYFALSGKPEGMGQFLDTPISYETSLIMFIMFLSLGIFGLAAVLGLLIRKKWGFWGTILVSIVTIAFDIWGVTIQFTAALGFIVPIISLAYFYFKKTQFLTDIK